MSSTNRGYDRHKSDYYVTPQPAIENFMYHFMKDIKAGTFDVCDEWSAGKFLEANCCLDPCAGGDKNHEMSYPSVIKSMLPHVKDLTTLDIREDSRADIQADYLEWELPDPTNPPKGTRAGGKHGFCHYVASP